MTKLSGTFQTKLLDRLKAGGENNKRMYVKMWYNKGRYKLNDHTSMCM